MQTCISCGSAVSRQFARVFGDNHHRIAGCPECSSVEDLMTEMSASRPGEGR